jgi:hypothetical protein
MSIGLLGFVMFLGAIALGAKSMKEMPSLNLRQMMTSSFLFWNGLILMTYASLVAVLAKLFHLF